MKIRALGCLIAIAVFLGHGGPVAAQVFGPPAMAGYGPAGIYGVAPVGYPMAGLQPMPPATVAGISDTEGSKLGCAVCGSSDCCGECCDPNAWCWRFRAFGEFLYLRARDSEVAYGVPIDGPIVPPPTSFPVQVGHVGVVDQDFDPGFRVGFGFTLDDYSSLTAQYTWFETTRFDEISTTAPDVIRSLVSHPGSASAATDYLAANANHYIKFDFIDVDYRYLISCCDSYRTNAVVGLRYGQLRQRFDAHFLFTGQEDVTTDIYYSAGGLKLGLEGEQFIRNTGLMVYGKAYGSLMAGEFTARYQQRQTFDPVVVDTSWKAGRIVPIADLEVGGGWESHCHTWRLTAGYVFSGWFNTVKTNQWINGVQRNSFVDLNDGMSFDGVVARIEGRF